MFQGVCRPEKILKVFFKKVEDSFFKKVEDMVGLPLSIFFMKSKQYNNKLYETKSLFLSSLNLWIPPLSSKPINNTYHKGKMLLRDWLMLLSLYFQKAEVSTQGITVSH